MNQGFNDNFDFRLKVPIESLDDFQKARIIIVDGIPTQVQSIIKKESKYLNIFKSNQLVHHRHI